MEVFLNFKKLSEKYPIVKEFSYTSKASKLYQALIYLANSNNIRSGMICREIGRFYLYGDGGVQRDLDDSIMWFGIGADTYKDAICQYHLGEIYNQKKYYNKELSYEYTYNALINLCNSVKDASFFYKLRVTNIDELYQQNPDVDLSVNKTDSYIIYLIGNIFFNKNFKLFNPEKAYYCYYIASIKGYAKAYKKLGDFSSKGILGKIDKKLAFEDYLKAYKNGYKPVDSILADMFAKGIGTKQDVFKAEKLYKESLGHCKNAHYKLAFLYIKYSHIFNKPDKTISYHLNQYIKINSNTNNLNDILNIAKLYLNGSTAFEKNIEEAVKFYKKAAQLNSIDAMYTLGYIFSSNKFGIKNKKYSVYSYKKAYEALIKAEKNHPNSYNEYRLGKMCLYGLGIKKNFSKAEKCFKKAIETDKNNAAAFFELFKLLKKHNSPQASYYLQCACKLNYMPALKMKGKK